MSAAAARAVTSKSRLPPRVLYILLLGIERAALDSSPLVCTARYPSLNALVAAMARSIIRILLTSAGFRFVKSTTSCMITWRRPWRIMCVVKRWRRGTGGSAPERSPSREHNGNSWRGFGLAGGLPGEGTRGSVR